MRHLVGPKALGGTLHVGSRQGSDEGHIDDTTRTATLDTSVAKFGGDGPPLSIGAMELLGPADSSSNRKRFVMFSKDGLASCGAGFLIGESPRQTNLKPARVQFRHQPEPPIPVFI